MNIMKMLGNLGNIAKMQQDIQGLTQELADKTFQGSAGGGLVKATVNGAQKVIRITIDPKLIDDKDRELIEDLAVAAINEAMATAKTETAEHLKRRLSEKYDLPELQSMLGNVLPK